MRTAFLTLLTAALLTSLGCHHNLARNGKGCSGCKQCGPGGGAGGYGGAGHGDYGGLAHGGGGHGGLGQGGFGHGGHGHGGFGHGGHHGGLGQGGLGGNGPARVPPLPHGYMNGMQNPAYGGPAGPTVGYPYYTIRGPRDFFVDDPPSIGY